MLVMGYSIKVQTLLQIEKKKWLFLVGIVALTHLFCQSLMLPYGYALLSLLPNGTENEVLKGRESFVGSSIKTNIDADGREFRPTNLNEESVVPGTAVTAGSDNVDGDINGDEGSMEKDKEGTTNISLNVDDMDNDVHFVEDETLDDVDLEKDDITMHNDRNKESGSALQVTVGESTQSFSLDQVAKKSLRNALIDAATLNAENDTIINDSVTASTLVVSSAKTLLIKSVLEDRSKSKASTSAGSSIKNKPVKKKMRCEMPPKTVLPINEMQQLLVRHRARSRAMRPRWSSERDQEIMAAKLQIENAPVLKNAQELYAPVFRNISTFKRSYELMERILKIYVYKEGSKPVFHQPILKGLYASEGWFMKLMEGNKQYVVKDPRKAHLFYMPFSSRVLEYKVYVRNSHNRTNLRQYLKDYSEKIAAKYRFWNRTGGADHFLVACHDWAPYETRHHMEHCIKALCNADVTMGFKIGRDVSFPETYVRSARNPLRDLGGKPPAKRHILSFYAGNMHGYLRPILLEYWKDKDPDMKILGPMPAGVASKMSYIEHMKSSKFCICPKGYEVNSPRIVEAIFYECVPVIISDNFVPPFFEVLNWDAFSVILAEKDIPNLKNILASIPEQKYLDLQLGVCKVQRHFLWHAKPVKYDLFHMTLHSIWNNRVFQMKPR